MAVKSIMTCLRQILGIKILFAISVMGLIYCVFYINRSDYVVLNSPDLCDTWRAAVPETNSSLHWWQWACMMERLWDKPVGYHCHDLKMMGNWPVCMDQPYQPHSPCLVYSFGIANDFSFDDAMAGQGCEVFSFDPSMGVPDHQHAHRVTFKALGLGVTDDDKFKPKWDNYVTTKQLWKIRKLQSIVSQLGHAEQILDALKVDVEVYEWAVINDLLQSDILSKVRQLLIEWHIFPNEPSREDFVKFYNILLRLEKAGFKQMYMSPYRRIHHLDYFNTQAEVAYVNSHLIRPSKT